MKLTAAERMMLQYLAERPARLARDHPLLADLRDRGLAEFKNDPRRVSVGRWSITEAGRAALSN